MCGLYGWAIDRQAARMLGPSGRRVMAWILASEMVERGDDSHGYYMPLSDKLYRRVGSALDTIADFCGQRVVLGHTRAATRGSVTVANAHPFDLGSIVGAHNGIIHNADELDAKFGAMPVDSLHVLRALAEQDPADVVERAKECEGYAALAWCGRNHPVWKSKGGVYLLRASDGASLECARLMRGGRTHGSVWASTAYALRVALTATWDRLPGCSHMQIELPVGEAACADDRGVWTVPHAPKIRVSSYCYTGKYMQNWRRHGSWVTLEHGGKAWRSYSDQMEEAEAEYNATGSDDALRRWMELDLQLERESKLIDDSELGHGWPCD